MFVLSYKSKDGQKFEFRSNEKTMKDAISNAENRIQELGYKCYGYEFISSKVYK